jgi:hypothetical protein
MHGFLTSQRRQHIVNIEEGWFADAVFYEVNLEHIFERKHTFWVLDRKSG